MNPICFYHSADLDGVCSGAIVKHFVPDCELYGIDYGDEFPWDKVRPGVNADTEEPGASASQVTHENEEPLVVTIPMRTVFMVDFSLPAEDMDRLNKSSKLVWIDHHKTAIEEMRAFEYIHGIQNPECAACELCWGWFEVNNLCRDPSVTAGKIMELLEEGTPFPEAVRLLGRYDVWDKDNPRWDTWIIPFQYGVRAHEGAYDPTSELWPDLFEGVEDYVEVPRKDFIVHCGNAALNFQKQQNAQACAVGAREAVIKLPGEPKTKIVDDKLVTFGPRFKFVDGGWKQVPETEPPKYLALACNTTVFNSQFFESMYDPERHDVMCAYSQMSDGRWKVCLYSTKDAVDCGAICKAFGGGGHKGSAGFICDRLPWETP